MRKCPGVSEDSPSTEVASMGSRGQLLKTASD